MKPKMEVLRTADAPVGPRSPRFQRLPCTARGNRQASIEALDRDPELVAVFRTRGARALEKLTAPPNNPRARKHHLYSGYRVRFSP